MPLRTGGMEARIEEGVIRLLVAARETMHERRLFISRKRHRWAITSHRLLQPACIRMT